MKRFLSLCGLLATLSCVKEPNTYLHLEKRDCTAYLQVYLPAKGQPVYAQGLLRHTLADSQGRLVHDIRWENPGQPHREHFIYEIPLHGDEPLQADLDVWFHDNRVINESVNSSIPQKCR